MGAMDRIASSTELGDVFIVTFSRPLCPVILVLTESGLPTAVTTVVDAIACACTDACEAMVPSCVVGWDAAEGSPPAAIPLPELKLRLSESVGKPEMDLEGAVVVGLMLGVCVTGTLVTAAAVVFGAGRTTPAAATDAKFISA